MTSSTRIEALPGVPPSLLGESPCWHPTQRVLYWCDIPGHVLNRFDPATGRHEAWHFDTDVACCAPLTTVAATGRASGTGTRMLLALRTGLAIFDTTISRLEALPDTLPYDPAVERFNDGKADARGRLWLGTIFEPRTQPLAGLFRFDAKGLTRVAGDATTGNGLAWSPDARTMYWADTPAHRIDAFDFDLASGTVANRRTFATFPSKQPGQDLATYGGRPDGAAIDAQGFYWVAMFEGARLVRLRPDGGIDREVRLPVRCPTMPCFGDADLRTVYVTTASHNRPADERAREPLAGCVLRLRVDVPGLPCHVARL
jgi:sugar lactone lactonase YvrE